VSGKRVATDDLKFTITTSLEADALVVRYGVDNRAERDVYLLNRVHDHALEPKQELAYVEFERGARLVHVYKDIPPIPEGRAPVMPYAPYVTPVRKHTRFGEAIRIELPVHEQRAYDPIQVGGTPATYRRLKLTIGFYWAAAGMRESEARTTAGTPFVSPIPPPGVQLEFGRLQEEVELSLPVLEPTKKAGGS
jgi:hypothetical protein